MIILHSKSHFNHTHICLSLQAPISEKIAKPERHTGGWCRKIGPGSISSVPHRPESVDAQRSGAGRIKAASWLAHRLESHLVGHDATLRANDQSQTELPWKPYIISEQLRWLGAFEFIVVTHRDRRGEHNGTGHQSYGCSADGGRRRCHRYRYTQRSHQIGGQQFGGRRKRFQFHEFLSSRSQSDVTRDAGHAVQFNDDIASVLSGCARRLWFVAEPFAWSQFETGAAAAGTRQHLCQRYAQWFAHE